MKKRLIWLIVLLATAVMDAESQEGFLRFELPDGMCAGSRDTLMFGYNGDFNVVFDLPMATQSVAERAFLPDGVECSPHGCKYRSTLTFSDFDSSATVTSSGDIKYVRLNMEHSFLGDLYISVVCPTGQRADLLKYSEYSNNTSLLSPCLDDIPSVSRGWTTPDGSNNRYAYLGEPSLNDNDNSPCNEAVNAAGRGWNYCWSNNNESGYTYAGNGGYVYRTANQTYVQTISTRTYYRVDSSNVAAGSNFYHPDQSFGNLVGCPLNGEWYIEVIDGVKQDNGYIFDWELSIDPVLLPTHCALEKRDVISPYVQKRNDSTYIFTAPSEVANDTMVGVLFRLINTCGDTLDSLAYITIHPKRESEERITACDSYELYGQTYTSDAEVTHHFTSVYGCDSVVVHKIKIEHSNSSVVRDTVNENELPYIVGGISVTESVMDSAIVIENAAGCDSTILLTLLVWNNSEGRIDTAVCRDELPIEIEVGGTTYTVGRDSTFSVTLVNEHGADSVIEVVVRVNENSEGEIIETIVENNLPWTTPIEGLVAEGEIDTLLHLNNAAGCDSTLHYSLNVWYNSESEIDTTLCVSGIPHRMKIGERTVEISSDTIMTVTIANVHGADSVVRLTVTLKPSSESSTRDRVCMSDMPYEWEGEEVAYNGNNEIIIKREFTNVYGCDSTVSLQLSVKGEYLKARAHVNPTVVSLENLEMEFHDDSRAARWRVWTVGDYVTTLQSFRYTYPAELDSVTAELTVGDGEGCEDKSEVLLQIDRSAVTSPNAFTPSLESNNKWYLATEDIIELELWIYNRNGNLVGHYTGVDGSWDGRTLDGQACPQGAYVYKALYRSRVYTERLKEKSGTILLIR